MLLAPSTPVVVVVWAGLGALVSGVVASMVQRGQHRVPRWQSAVQISVTGAVFALLAFRYASLVDLLVTSAFALGAVPLAIEDARTSRLPNRLIILLYCLVVGTILAAWLATPGSGLLGRGVVGLMLCLTFFWLLYALVPGGLGGGDVKLAGPVGAALACAGWSVLLAGVLLGWLAVGVGHGLARMSRRDPGPLPLGPFLIAAAIVVLLVPMQ